MAGEDHLHGEEMGESTADPRGSRSDDRVCVDHFLDMDFTIPRELSTQLGYKRHSLKPDAVLSQKMGGPDEESPSPKRQQTAAVKLKIKWMQSCLLFASCFVFISVISEYQEKLPLNI